MNAWIQPESVLDLQATHADGQYRDPVSHRIHRKERSELKVLSRHFDRGQQGAEVEVLREGDLPVEVGVVANHAFGGVWLADIDPMDCVMTRGYEKPLAEIEISISSTLHAAYASS